MILAGDIGGTKTNVALFEAQGGKIGAPQNVQSFPSARHESLNVIIEQYVAQHKVNITHACFGIAGPVVGGKVEATNLPWVIHDKALSQVLNGAHVRLINDLEANAYGIETLRDEQFYTLNEGDPTATGHRALIAAGTGLGMAGLFYDGARYHPMPSEGGHTDFAPRTPMEEELRKYLAKKFAGHVSYERALSGMGIYNIYQFLRDEGYAEEPSWLAEEIATGDKSAAISRAGTTGKAEIAVKAMQMFVETYGAMAGNLGLILKATGGVYIGGGIAPKILEKLEDGTFMRTFKDKGRLSPLVAAMPVRVILEDKTALYGAAQCALNTVTSDK
ncbi:MAG: glucokinase [Pyrinomonadaceae bacterium]